MPGPPPTGSPFSQTPLGPGTRCHSTLLPVNLLKPSRDHCSQPHSTKGLPCFYLHLYISSHFLTAREGSANTSQQYENTPEAVLYLTRKKKKNGKLSSLHQVSSAQGSLWWMFVAACCLDNLEPVLMVNCLPYIKFPQHREVCDGCL